MTAALSSAVELLERSLSYTKVALARVQGAADAAVTPCHGWPLTRLLAHMDDALDAWTESSTGRLTLAPSTGLARLDSIRTKACLLLGWWLEQPPAAVAVGTRWLPADVLVGTAALEITLHGWDLHRTAGHEVDVPPDLAGPLLEVARGVVPGDRLPCFGPPRPVAPDAPAPQQLLALAGRA